MVKSNGKSAMSNKATQLLTKKAIGSVDPNILIQFSAMSLVLLNLDPLKPIYPMIPHKE